MAFSDLCKISNAFKSVENEPDQSERIMEENSMVRDLITKILDETGPSDFHGPAKPVPDKPLDSVPYHKNDILSYPPPTFNIFPEHFNFNDQNFNFNVQNDLTNGFNFNDNDVTSLLGIEDTAESVTQEQLNLLRLAAQEIGGAQFTTPNQNYNFFEPNQRNSLPEPNMFPNNFNQPNGINLDYNNPYMNPNQQFPKYQEGTQDAAEIMAYINQMNIADRPNEVQKMLPDNQHFDEYNKMQNYNRYQQLPPKTFPENYYANEMMKNGDKNYPLNQNFDYQNQFKTNGYHQNDFQRRDMQRDFPNGPMNDRNFDQMQQAAIMRQNQELARQMSLLMRNRPPPNPLNVDVSFLHENPQFNLGIGGLLGPSPPAAVLPSPMLDLPLLAPFYAMRNMRSSHTSSAILHYRLDTCYEQWRQLERERKRTEAKLALAYPGRAVSSSNSIPVPRLPPAPTRVDRLTVDMLREHTKVLTLMGKMETLRASVCVAQNKKPNKEEKITVLKRGQDNTDKDGVDPATFEPGSWREDVKHLAEIAPHSEVESAMLLWRGAVAAVQAARRRELAADGTRDPILQLAEAIKQLSVSARRARCAMWSDLTLTVALAQHLHQEEKSSAKSSENNASSNGKQKPADNKEEKRDKASDTSSVSSTSSTPPKNDNNNKPQNNNNKTATKPQEKQQENTKNQQRRSQNRQKINRPNDIYNKRYEPRFMQNRHPYYLATGPIN